MIPAVNSVNFNGNNANGRSKSDDAAAGVGAVGATYASGKAASKGVRVARDSMQTSTRVTERTIGVLNGASKNVGKFRKLINSFLAKKAEFMSDYEELCKALKNTKLIGKIMNNPIANKAGSFFGGVMAFFVLVPSILNMVNVVEDISNR